MNYWYLMTQDCIYPVKETRYMDKIKYVVVVTKEEKMPNRLLEETNWIGTNENDDGATKVTMLLGWSQLNEKAFNAIKTKVDVIWYVEENRWEWPCMDNEVDDSYNYVVHDMPPAPTLTSNNKLKKHIGEYYYGDMKKPEFVTDRQYKQIKYDGN